MNMTLKVTFGPCMFTLEVYFVLPFFLYLTWVISAVREKKTLENITLQNKHLGEKRTALIPKQLNLYRQVVI